MNTMKKRINYVQSVLIGFCLIGLFSSCQEYYENKPEVNSDQQDIVYTKISKDSWDFEYGVEYYGDDDNQFRSKQNYEIRATLKADGNSHVNRNLPYFVDARTSDGYSTWSSPEFTFVLDLEKTKSNYASNGHYHFYTSQITMSSPPAHLHLVLKNLEESPSIMIPQKTWKVVSVTDESGKSLADDPDWTNYTDNLMTFQKATNFIYTPGAKRSKTELDFFGTEKEHPTLYGTYTVKEDASKKVTLTLAFPDFQQHLEVVESSWTSLTLKGIIAGKTGLAKFVPVN